MREPCARQREDGVAKYLESVCLIGHSFGSPFLFEEFLDCLAALADGVGLPRAVDAARISLIQCGSSVDIKTDNESANAEGACAAALGILLLDARNISGDVSAGRCELEIKIGWKQRAADRRM